MKTQNPLQVHCQESDLPTTGLPLHLLGVFFMEEIWKDIVNFEGYYQVSNHGNVKSLSRTVLYKDGRKWHIDTKILRPCFTTKGYLYVNLSKNGHPYPYVIHRLVANAFIAKIDNKPQVNHKDTVKTNNKASNLEWVNNSENQIHSVRNGTGGAKLTVKNVLFIKTHPNFPTHILATMFDVCDSNIVSIRAGKTWKHVII